MRAASCVAAGLSVSHTLMKTLPSSGSSTPAPACALPNAAGKSSAMPITSPVDFISGPSSASVPWSRWNGQHRLLDAHVRAAALARQVLGRKRSPRISRQATFASGTPIAFDTNGTVRDARGFASIT